MKTVNKDLNSIRFLPSWILWILGFFLIFQLVRSSLSEASWISLETPQGKLEQVFMVYRPVTGYSLISERLKAELTFKMETGPLYWNFTPRLGVDLPSPVAGRPQLAIGSADVKEGWVEWRSSPLDIRVGYQWLTWGAADEINPTDVFNPKNFFDPLLSEKLSTLALRLDVHPTFLDGWNLQILASPFFRPSLLPIHIPESGTHSLGIYDSRWMIPIPNLVDIAGVTNPLLYDMASPTYPVSWAAGARLSTIVITGWDFSLSTYHGVEDLPRLAVTTAGDAGDPNLPVTVTLHPSYHRFSMFGFDGQTGLNIFDEEIGLRFEMAYTIRDNSRALTAPVDFQDDLSKDPFFHGVIGLDYTLPTPIFGSTLYLNLQYVHYQRIGAEQEPGNTQFRGLPTAVVWDRNLSFFIENRFSYDFRISQVWILSLQNWDGFWNPKAHFQLSDSFNLNLGFQIFFGNPEGFFGQLGDNSRFLVEAKFSF